MWCHAKILPAAVDFIPKQQNGPRKVTYIFAALTFFFSPFPNNFHVHPGIHHTYFPLKIQQTFGNCCTSRWVHEVMVSLQEAVTPYCLWHRHFCSNKRPQADSNPPSPFLHVCAWAWVCGSLVPRCHSSLGKGVISQTQAADHSAPVTASLGAQLYYLWPILICWPHFVDIFIKQPSYFISPQLIMPVINTSQRQF